MAPRLKSNHHANNLHSLNLQSKSRICAEPVDPRHTKSYVTHEKKRNVEQPLSCFFEQDAFSGRFYFPRGL